ncbi:hypothetical protein DFQ26_005978 [Actinomortierella ambigua]|nr:hypothetical protein DFQ26_005978 [Actinomortierella ambigua]
MQPFCYSPTCLRGRRRVTIEKCMHAWEQQQENAGDDQQNGSSGSSIRTVGYEAECRESNSHNGSSTVDGVNSAAASSLAHRSWGKASNDDWSRPPPLLHLPHTRVWQAEIEEDIEEEDWGSPEVVAAMRPLSSATACWTDVAVVDCW